MWLLMSADVENLECTNLEKVYLKVESPRSCIKGVFIICTRK